MRSRYLSMVLGGVLTGVSGGVWAKEAACMQQFGTMVCGAGTTQEIDASGIVSLQGTEVLGRTRVRGNLLAEEAKLQQLSVQGNASLLHCDINGVSEIEGAFRSRSCHFSQPIHVSGNQVWLAGTELPGLTVRVGASGISTVVLKEQSQVRGDIHFVGGEGRVVLSQGSQVGGKIVGGRRVQ